MRSPPKHMTIRTNVSEEMYNCIENPLSISPPSSPQHHNLNDNHTNIELPSLSTTTIATNNNNNNNNNLHHPTNVSSSNGSNGYHKKTPNKKKMERFEISQTNNNHYYDGGGEEDEEYGEYHDDDTNSNHRQHQNHNNNNENDNDNDNNLPSNENLLGTAFGTFMGFATIQIVVAYFAGSEAMMGDSAAMVVDSMTYLFNWYAERKKSTYDSIEWKETILSSYSNNNNNNNNNATTNMDQATTKRILERTKRKNILQLELIPPILSVGTLIIVTFFVLKESITVLLLDRNREIDEQGNPNIHIMFGFSIANLGLDLANVANFAKAKHLFGFETTETPPHTTGAGGAYGHEALPGTDSSEDHDDEMIDGSPNKATIAQRVPSHNFDEDDEEEDEDQDHTANLNMCSAYTHVFADTLRSIAVLVAAGLAEVITGITPEEADASAAVVVSILILLSLLPLFSGLIQSYNELRLIRAEERNDELLMMS